MLWYATMHTAVASVYADCYLYLTICAIANAECYSFNCLSIRPSHSDDTMPRLKSLTPDKELNIFIYRALSHIGIFLI